MPKGPAAGPSQIPSKQIQLLENKVNKLRWVNDDLNKKAFEAQQRGLRLAEKLGFATLEEAEAALATQTAEEGQSQLSQYPSDELASHIQALQSELLSHVNLGKTTLAALNDAMEELSAWKEENTALRAELERVSAERAADDAANASDATEVDYLREELATLQKQYADLQEAKVRSDEKHAEDFGRWRRFKEWLVEEERRQKEKLEERAAKRRKLSPRGEDDEKENEGNLSPDRLSASELEKKYGNIKRRLQELGPLSLRQDTPTRVRSPAPKRSKKRKPAVLTSRNLNSRSIPPPPPATVASSSKLAETPARPQNLKRGAPDSVIIPDDDVHPSSETELESQPVAYLFPSQIDITAVPSTIPRKRPRSPVHDQDSSETEVESQAPSYLFPSQMDLSARISDMTPKPRPTTRQAAQLFTPVSAVRPHQAPKGKGKARSSSSENTAPPSSLNASDPFHPALPPAEQEDVKPVLPETPVSLGPRKAQERAVPEGRKSEPNDGNAAPSTSEGKKRPNDYSAFKGRGRYGEEQRAGNQETTINALYALDPANNGGNAFQYEEVVRDKQKRKHMHAGDCECCRDYYDAIKPLPPRAQAPLWRSPDSTPSKPPRGDSDSFGDAGAAAAIEEHKQAISRHRQHWARAKTPPGYWNIGFPDTQEVAAMNAEAARMHAQKRSMVAQEADRRGGRFKRR